MQNKLSLLGILLIGFLLSFSTLSKKTIIIDAGHGGTDNGASVKGIYEKDINMKVANIIKRLASDRHNIEVILTHDGKTTPSLSDRISIINKINPALMISLHTNSSSDKENNGVEIFVQNTYSSKKIAERLSSLFGNVEIKEQNLRILKESKAPSIVLEMGYLSNDKDREYLTSTEGQQEIAHKIFQSIIEE